MKIGISAAVIDRGRNGIAQYVFSLARAFRNCAPEHQFLIFTLKEDLTYFAPAAYPITLVPISEKNRPPLRNLFWHQTALPLLARKHHLDVLHVPTYRRLPFAQPCATVATIHDLAPFYVPKKYDWPRMLYCRHVAGRLAQRQNRIIAVSHSTATSIQDRFNIPATRLATIYNGLDHSRFFPGDLSRAVSVVAERYGVIAPFILYVSRLEHPGKNHLRLLEAFQQIRMNQPTSLRLVLVGSDSHGASVIHSAIQQSPVGNYIHAPGFVPDDILPDLYRAASALVFPSLYEGFGLPILEAMACGCPVLCSTAGSLPEIAGNAALYCNADDTNSIVHNLTRLLADFELRQKLCEAGIVRAGQFRHEETARQTLVAYAEAHSSYSGRKKLDGRPVHQLGEKGS